MHLLSINMIKHPDWVIVERALVQLHCDVKNHDKILSFQFKYSQKVFHMIRQYVWWFWTNHQTVCKIISNVRWADGFLWTLGWAWLWRLGLGISWRYIPIRDSKSFTSLRVLGTHGPWSLWVPEHWEWVPSLINLPSPGRMQVVLSCPK